MVHLLICHQVAMYRSQPAYSICIIESVEHGTREEYNVTPASVGLVVEIETIRILILNLRHVLRNTLESDSLIL